MKKTLKICSIMLVICMMLTTLGVTAFAEGEVGVVYRSSNMEPNGGIVTNLQFTGNGADPGGEPIPSAISNGILIQNRNGVYGLGVDGSAAATYGSVSNNGLKYFISITDQAKISVTAGYTYFKSAMMRLNPDVAELIPALDGKKLDATKKITAFNEIGGKGFASTADNFKSTLDAYDGSTVIKAYDWHGTDATSLSHTLTNDWQRITECYYYDAEGLSGTSRSGWHIFGNKWNAVNSSWSGNWQIVVDDYVVLKTPNTALKSVSYPVVYGAKLDKSGTQEVGTTLTASYTESYDVNPMLSVPTVKYQWQKSSDGSTWNDISGATASSYTISSDDASCLIRVKLTAENKTYDSADAEIGTTVSATASYSGTVNTAVEYNGRVIRAEHMNGTGGAQTYLAFNGTELNTASNPITSVVPTTDGSKPGVYGNGASYLVKSIQMKGAAALMDSSYQASHRGPMKSGYTYFKSIMMKLNPENTDATTTSQGLKVWSFHNQTGAGFASDAESFASKLSSYNGTTAFPEYDWTGTKEGTVTNIIKTDSWQRVTDCIYNAGYSGDMRSGWVVWFKSWNAGWCQNWELMIDDYIVIEVPNYALKSVAYPVAYGVKVMAGSEVSEVLAGTSLTASAQYYDVNALINGTADNYLTYQWQKSADGVAWTNIEGATSSVYAPAYSDGFVRAEIKAVSKTRDFDNGVLDTVASPAVYSSSVKVTKPEMTVSVTSKTIDSEGFEYIDKDNNKQTFSGKSIISYGK